VCEGSFHKQRSCSSVWTFPLLWSTRLLVWEHLPMFISNALGEICSRPSMQSLRASTSLAVAWSRLRQDPLFDEDLLDGLAEFIAAALR
jgi:hypothetical protein